MKSMTLAQLGALQPALNLLRLRSFDPDIYLVEMVIQDETYRLTDTLGRPMAFRSQLAAKKPFKGLSVERAELVQESAYDEMIGQPQRTGRNTLRVDIARPKDDLS